MLIDSEVETRMRTFFGNRVIKTGISVFLTAIICEWLNWPPVFAVITAIVTVEPTVSDSIKKGIIRFPASAIGSAYAVFFIALFGNSPITYTLAAVLTILTCYKLNLHSGLLVATLTAVAMVEVIHSNYLISFFIRLGTTTTGLLVSTLVNFLIFPPDYRDDIIRNIQAIGKRTGVVLEKTFRNILYDPDENHIDQTKINQLDKSIRRTESLIRFQKDESKLHPLVGGDKGQLRTSEKQLAFLHALEYHLDYLIQMPINKISWSKSERDLIMEAVIELGGSLRNRTNYDPDQHKQRLREITEIFWEDNEEITKGNHIHPTRFPPELILLYELVSIYNLVESFYNPDNVKPSRKKS